MYLKICLKHTNLKILLCAMSFLFLCSCAPTSDESVEISTHPTIESLTSDPETAKTTALETSMEAVFPLNERLSEEMSFISFDAEKTEPTEGQDDFSDVSGLELSSEQVKEKLSSIVERTRYAKITNDMDTEEIILRLMDRYLLCVYTYDNTTLFDIVTDENGSWIEVEDQDQNTYYKIKHSCFDNLNEMEHFVRETFSSETADRWIKASSSGSPESYIPKFIQREDGIYYCMPKYEYSFPPPFLDNFIIEIKECSETECVFSYNANVDPERFIQMRIANGRIPPSEFDFFHEGKIILEDGKWKIDSIFPTAF